MSKPRGQSRVQVSWRLLDNFPDFGSAEAQLGEDGAAMLAQRRHRVHARLEAVEVERRLHRSDHSPGRADLAPAIARFELRVLPELLHGIELGVGDAGPFEPADNL